jgi:hypothetical protein
MAKDKKSDSIKSKKDGKEKKGKKKDKAAKEAEAKVEKQTAPPAPKPAKKAEKKTAKAKPASKPAVAISNDDISLRAYFIAERRQAMGWPGDSSSDWAEAERQLKAEAAKKAKG